MAHLCLQSVSLAQRTHPHKHTLHTHMKLTTHKAAGGGLEDASALEALWVSTGGIDAGLQTTCHQPVRQPLELAVAQEAVALNKAVRERKKRKRGEGDVNTLYITSVASLTEYAFLSVRGCQKALWECVFI